MLLRSVLVEREPIYRQQETVATFAPQAFGLSADLSAHVGDDAIGRALDHLFDADRGSLLTEVVVTAARRFDLSFEELHNDSTSIRFCGQYPHARGRSIRGQRAPFITHGYSKDHRADLKQLLFILTTSRDGGVPVQFRCEAGNENDARTHQETWDTLCRAIGRNDFLYVADSKLCSRDALDHLDRRGGRFVCVMPRTRLEDREFRAWIQTHDPSWELVRDRRHPRRRHGPRDRWWTVRSTLPSREGWPVVWVRSSLLALRQEQVRREHLARATRDLEALAARLARPRSRLRARREIMDQAQEVLTKYHVREYLTVQLAQAQEHRFHQAGPGRPGPPTRYLRKTRRLWNLTYKPAEQAITYDRRSDGMYPLLTNDAKLTNVQVLEAYKRQSAIEKRFEQTKTVFELAPVLLKNEGRIEALFFVYFLALLVQALIERELRAARKTWSTFASIPKSGPAPTPRPSKYFAFSARLLATSSALAGATSTPSSPSSPHRNCRCFNYSTSQPRPTPPARDGSPKFAENSRAMSE